MDRISLNPTPGRQTALTSIKSTTQQLESPTATGLLPGIPDLEHREEVLRSCWDMISWDLIDSVIDQLSNRVSYKRQSYWASTEVAETLTLLKIYWQ